MSEPSALQSVPGVPRVVVEPPFYSLLPGGWEVSKSASGRALTDFFAQENPMYRPGDGRVAVGVVAVPKWPDHFAL